MNPMDDWQDHGGWCALFVTVVFFGAAIYAAFDLWRMLP